MSNKQKQIKVKETKETIELEKNMLKITLEHMAKENEQLKRLLEDMKITAQSNKNLLMEYIETITNKDKVVEKMNNTIEQLQARLISLQDHQLRNNNSNK